MTIKMINKEDAPLEDQKAIEAAIEVAGQFQAKKKAKKVKQTEEAQVIIDTMPLQIEFPKMTNIFWAYIAALFPAQPVEEVIASLTHSYDVIKRKDNAVTFADVSKAINEISILYYFAKHQDKEHRQKLIRMIREHHAAPILSELVSEASDFANIGEIYFDKDKATEIGYILGYMTKIIPSMMISFGLKEEEENKQPVNPTK